jgi:hypothetical protein
MPGTSRSEAARFFNDIFFIRTEDLVYDHFYDLLLRLRTPPQACTIGTDSTSVE